MASADGRYYVPSAAHWPIVGSIGLTTMFAGAANWIHGHSYGPYLFTIGAIITMIMMTGWFSVVIAESESNTYNPLVSKSFRWGMIWFIFSEVCFFGVFFGALYYAREVSVPWLGGEGGFEMTKMLIWPSFKAGWPLLTNPDQGLFTAPKEIMHAWGIPALNTAILLTSGATLTWAHWGLVKENRRQLIIGLILTVALGISFLTFQAIEYGEAYKHFGLTLDSGIYGTTFFMLTGFHGLHVTIGTIMLITMTIRSMRGHFTPKNHFAFEATAWYWHFVDVVWLLLFVFVYWI